MLTLHTERDFRESGRQRALKLLKMLNMEGMTGEKLRIALRRGPVVQTQTVRGGGMRDLVIADGRASEDIILSSVIPESETRHFA